MSIHHRAGLLINVNNQFMILNIHVWDKMEDTLDIITTCNVEIKS